MSGSSNNTLQVLSARDSITAWYRPASTPNSRDIAQEAYQEALDYLKKELGSNDQTRKLIESRTSIEDVQTVVQKAKDDYGKSSSGRKDVHEWLSKFSSRIMYYGQVLDMLSQHHPEYVALAWGSLKFVLTGILNHAKLVVELSKALIRIGDVLPRTKLSAELYQTEHMKEAISRLYAHILLFFQQAVKWWNMGPAKKAVSVILKPFELDYKDTVEQIRICAKTVDDIANAAARAEVRDINIILQLQGKKLQEREASLQQTYEKLHDMQIQLRDVQTRIDNKVQSVFEVVTINKAISENIQVDVQDIKPRIYDLQFVDIMKILRPYPSPEDVLRKCQSLAKRSQAWSSSASHDATNLLESLSRWVSKSGSSLFIVRAGPRAEARAKEFALDVITLLQSTQYPVFWSLSHLGSDRDTISTTDVLKSLVFQALQCDPDVFLKNPAQLNASQFQTNHSETEWLDLLRNILSKLTKCFVVVETEDLFHAFRHDIEWIKHFLALFQGLVDSAASSGNMIKVLVVSYGSAKAAIEDLPEDKSRIVTTVQRPVPVPPRLRRPIRKAGRGGAWHHLRPKF